MYELHAKEIRVGGARAEAESGSGSAIIGQPMHCNMTVTLIVT
jgi:hypothetical protein